MGIVFLAIDSVLERMVAIKLILSLDGFTHPEAGKRLIQEARAAGRLSHPNIVSIYSYGIADHLQYNCMEYVPGKSLAQALRETQQITLEKFIHILPAVSKLIEKALSKDRETRYQTPTEMLQDLKSLPFGTTQGVDVFDEQTVVMQKGKQVQFPTEGEVLIQRFPLPLPEGTRQAEEPAGEALPRDDPEEPEPSRNPPRKNRSAAKGLLVEIGLPLLITVAFSAPSLYQLFATHRTAVPTVADPPKAPLPQEAPVDAAPVPEDPREPAADRDSAQTTAPAASQAEDSLQDNAVRSAEFPTPVAEPEGKSSQASTSTTASLFLIKADMARQEGRIFSPEADNAFHYYGTVLDLEPANTKAFESLMRMAEELVTNARNGAGNPRRANQQLNQAERILQAIPLRSSELHSSSIQKVRNQMASTSQSLERSNNAPAVPLPARTKKEPNKEAPDTPNEGQDKKTKWSGVQKETPGAKPSSSRRILKEALTIGQDSTPKQPPNPKAPEKTKRLKEELQ